MNIRFKVVGAEKVAQYIQSLPKGIKAAAMRAISEYIVGDESHGLRHDVAYKHVPRSKIPNTITIDYGPHKGKKVRGYFSSKQYYYVILGNVTTGRKNDPTKMGQSWKWEQKDSQWSRTEIKGTLPFDRFPARHNRLAGWRHHLEVIRTNIAGAMLAGQRAVDEWLKSKK